MQTVSVSPDIPLRERTTKDDKLNTRGWNTHGTFSRVRRGAMSGARLSSRQGQMIARRDYEGH